MMNPALIVEAPSSTKVNILVVDDRPDGLLALEAMLSCENYNLIKASSGREALQYAALYDFAVILLDVQMPELDGFETAKLLRENYRSKNTPIIFVTAINKENRHINQGYESGAVDYIFKPFDPLILQSKVDIFVELFKKNLEIKQQAALLRELELQENARQMSELQEESLRRYVNLADAVPHMVLKISRDGKIEYLNQRCYHYVGLLTSASFEEWKIVIHPKDRRKFLVFWLHMRRQQLQNHQIEIRIRGENDGTYRWHLVKVVAEVNDDEVIGWIATATDIDYVKKTEESFRGLSEELNRSNKDLEQFAFVASHDLQEPLRIVSSYVDLLLLKQKGKLDDSSKEILDVVKIGVTRAQRLIRDLLEYARIGIKEKKFYDADLKNIVGQAVFNISLLIKEKNAQITYDPLPALAVDEIQMVQVFQNFLANSLKYCQQSPKIHIGAKKITHEWIFSVADNGIGIDSKYFDKIFVIFQRLHHVDQYQGTGIGLAICKKIIERHDGRIWVESELNKGTTFYFTIPYSRNSLIKN